MRDGELWARDPSLAGGPALILGLFWYGGIGFFGWFLILFLILAFVFLIVRIVFWSARQRRWQQRRNAYAGGYRGYGGGGGGPGDSAMAIARRRYARGEISREQYDQIMTDLNRRRPGP